MVIFMTFSTASCDNDVVRNGKLEEYIPQNTVAVFKIKQLKSLLTDFNNNGLLNNIAQDSSTLFNIERISLLKYLEPKAESILCFNKTAEGKLDFTFITKDSKNLFKTDSLKDKLIETLSYDDKQIQKVTINNEVSFSSIVDSVYIATSSQKILESILDGSVENDAVFNKVYDAQNNSNFGLLVKNRKISVSDSTKKIELAKWYSLDIELQPKSISATGIAVGRDSLHYLIDIFEGQTPQENNIASITPTNAKKITAFTISDSDLFLRNLSAFSSNQKDSIPNEIFRNISEVAEITFQDEKVIILNSNDETTTDAALAKFVNQGEIYREISINSFTEADLFSKKLDPIITTFSANYIFQIDSFFIFSENILTANQFINDYSADNVLGKQGYYKTSSSKIGTTSSLLFINFDENVPQLLNSVFNSSEENKIKKEGFDKYSMAVFQLSYDRDFAHVAFVCNEISRKAIVAQNTSAETKFTLDVLPIGAIKIYNPSKNQDVAIVVQDAANTLYSISKTGKANWTKKLDGPIVGGINEVDVLKNGTNQLAFVTEKTFYILDKNGADVKQFPVKFKDKITQPLAVFDYDNNENYRFVIIQAKDILMYDKAGKVVKGFMYTKAKSNIVLPPKHIRMGSKDYLIFAEDNGNLNILSRTGKPRVTANKKFDFGVNNIFEQGGSFAVVTKDNNFYTISESGKIGSRNLENSKEAKVAASEDLIVSLDTNVLIINNITVEMPIGNYTRPSILYSKGRKLITFTETLEKKVYLYDASGILADGFPILGSSKAAFGEDDDTKLISASFGNGNIINIVLQ